jgi:hypothetical protein
MYILQLVTSHSHLKDGEIGPFTGNVIYNLTNNPVVTVAPEKLAKIKLFKEDFEAKHVVSMNGLKADVISKNEAKLVLVEGLNEFAIELCMLTKGDREKLAKTGFILVKEADTGKEPPKPTNFKVVNGVNDGSLLFSVKSHSDARMYVFLYTLAEAASADLTTWHQVSSTSSKKEIDGFKHGVDYLCRCAYMGTKGKLIYSDAITVLAH